MQRVVTISTGGTIASRHSAEHGAVVSVAGADELIGLLGPLAPAGVAVSSEQFCNIGSYQIDLATSFRLAKRIGAVLDDPDVAGVVVTHGTDTMEESAYLADLVIASAKPVVFTGAQRHADEPDGDGPRNLADAVRVASSPEARDLGVMICFDGEIHAARDATKMHSARVGTFTSFDHGKLGDVDNGRVAIQRRPTRHPPIATEKIECRIDLIKLVMGLDDRFVRLAVKTGARALVLEAFGRGNATVAVTEAVREAIGDGLIVAVATRCPQGRVLPIYGNGGGKDLAAAGAVFAGDLTAIKARLLLALLVGSGASPDTIRREIANRGN